MRSKLIAFLVAAVMIVGLPISAPCAAPPIAEILPPDSFGYVELSDTGVLYYVISEVGRAAIESLQEEEALPEQIKLKARALLEAFEEIEPLLPRSASLGVASIDTRTGQPSLVIVSELSEELAPLVSAAGKLLAAVPNLKVTKTEQAVEVVLPRGGPRGKPTIGYAVKDNVLYVAMGQGLIDRVLSMQPSESLAQTVHFREVNAVTGEDAFLSAYINVDALREKLLPVAPPQARAVAELLGLQGIHAAGFSLSANESVVGSNFAIQYTEDVPGIPSFLSVPNTQPKGIAYVPQDFSYVARFSLGPPAEFMAKVRAILDKVGQGQKLDQACQGLKEGLGIDVNRILASLGGEITLGMKIPETLGMPNIVACLEAKDPEYLIQTLKNLLKGDNAPASVAEIEIAGRKTIVISPKVPVPVSPAIAVDGDMIVIGISSAALQKALEAKQTGQNIASNPGFRAAMQNLPAGKNIGLEYVDMGDLGQLIVSGLGVAAASAPAEAQPMLSKSVQYVNRAFQDLEDAVEVAYRTPNGLATQSRWSTRSLMQVLTNGAALAAKAGMWLIVRRHVSEAERVEPTPTPPEAAPTTQ